MIKNQLIKAAVIMLISFSLSNVAFAANKTAPVPSPIYKIVASAFSVLPSVCKNCLFGI